MKTLKIVSSLDNKHDEIIKEAGDHNLDHSSGWYLHGNLESLLHYDIGTIYNMSEFPEDVRETLRWGFLQDGSTEVEKFSYFPKSYLHGVYPVEVYGVEEECIGYFWITDEEECIARTADGDKKKFLNWRQRGLICLKSDEESVKEAKEHYAKNSSYL